jgi:hypothetical protein
MLYGNIYIGNTGRSVCRNCRFSFSSIGSHFHEREQRLEMTGIQLSMIALIIRDTYGVLPYQQPSRFENRP